MAPPPVKAEKSDTPYSTPRTFATPRNQSSVRGTREIAGTVSTSPELSSRSSQRVSPASKDRRALGAASPAIRAVYPLFPAAAHHGFVAYALLQFLYFGAWEVLFRGVLLFGLRRDLGNGPANVLQTALSVTAHFGRAINETASALPAGLVFGWVDLKLGSIWYVALLHWLVGVSMDWFIMH